MNAALSPAEQSVVDRFDTTPPAPESLRERVAEAIEQELQGRCSHCLRPLPSDADWRSYQGGEGEHLCWEPPGACCFSFPGLSVGSIAADAASRVLTGGAS